MDTARISIVGGGIGGLSAALALQRFGHRVSVFEQARELREVGAGVIITPNAMHALDFLGVGERIAREAGPCEAMATRHFETGEVLKLRPAGTDYGERFGASYHQVHRVDLHTALADAVRENDPDCVVLGSSLRIPDARRREGRGALRQRHDARKRRLDRLRRQRLTGTSVRLRRGNGQLYRPGRVSRALADERCAGEHPGVSLCACSSAPTGTSSITRCVTALS